MLSVLLHQNSFLLDEFQILPHTDVPKSYPGTATTILRIEHTVLDEPYSLLRFNWNSHTPENTFRETVEHDLPRRSALIDRYSDVTPTRDVHLPDLISTCSIQSNFKTHTCMFLSLYIFNCTSSQSSSRFPASLRSRYGHPFTAVHHQFTPSPSFQLATNLCSNHKSTSNSEQSLPRVQE